MKKILLLIFSIFLLNFVFAQDDSSKFVPGIGITSFFAHTTNAHPVSYFIDFNPNINVRYNRNSLMFGPVLGTRRVSLQSWPAPVFLKWGLNGFLFCYQRELLSGKNTSFKLEYNGIYQFLNYKGIEYSYGEEYIFKNFLFQQTMGYVFDFRFAKNFTLAQHLGVGYGSGKYKLDYTKLPAEYEVQKSNKGFTTLIKLNLGYSF